MIASGDEFRLDTIRNPVICPSLKLSEAGKRPKRRGGADWFGIAEWVRNQCREMSDSSTTIAEIKNAVGQFAAERSWEPFHSPKNLAMALAAEAGELLEPFLWIESAASRDLVNDPSKRQAVADELADVAILLCNLSLATKIDLSDAIRDKMIRNAQKYPVPSIQKTE